MQRNMDGYAHRASACCQGDIQWKMDMGILRPGRLQTDAPREQAGGQWHTLQSLIMLGIDPAKFDGSWRPDISIAKAGWSILRKASRLLTGGRATVNSHRKRADLIT